MPIDILIIDDEEVVINVFQELLSSREYRVFQAMSGKDGLDIVQQRPFPVVILDKNLPDISGIEVLRKIKEVNPSTEVIIITAYGSMETAIQALELGAYDYIPKPFGDLKDVRTTIDRALEKYRISSENKSLLRELQEKTDALEETVAKLQEAQRVLIDMTARIAHEVRNPLISISTIAYILNEDFEDGHPAKKEAQKIIAEAKRMDGILSEILEFSRPRELILRRHNIKSIIENSLKPLMKDCESRGVKIMTELPDDLPLIPLDSGQMMQVFLNIIRNSLEAMDGSGWLQINASRHKEDIWVEIMDSGRGVEPRVLKKIFTPFFSTKVTGTGLGLSISRKIIEGHGGDIKIANRKGGGAQVTIRLPVKMSHGKKNPDH